MLHNAKAILIADKHTIFKNIIKFSLLPHRICIECKKLFGLKLKLLKFFRKVFKIPQEAAKIVAFNGQSV